MSHYLGMTEDNFCDLLTNYSFTYPFFLNLSRASKQLQSRVSNCAKNLSGEGETQTLPASSVFQLLPNLVAIKNYLIEIRTEEELLMVARLPHLKVVTLSLQPLYDLIINRNHAYIQHDQERLRHRMGQVMSRSWDQLSILMVRFLRVYHQEHGDFQGASLTFFFQDYFGVRYLTIGQGKICLSEVTPSRSADSFEDMGLVLGIENIVGPIRSYARPYPYITATNADEITIYFDRNSRLVAWNNLHDLSYDHERTYERLKDLFRRVESKKLGIYADPYFLMLIQSFFAYFLQEYVADMDEDEEENQPFPLLEQVDIPVGDPNLLVEFSMIFPHAKKPLLGTIEPGDVDVLIELTDRFEGYRLLPRQEYPDLTGVEAIVDQDNLHSNYPCPTLD